MRAARRGGRGLGRGRATCFPQVAPTRRPGGERPWGGGRAAATAVPHGRRRLLCLGPPYAARPRLLPGCFPPPRASATPVRDTRWPPTFRRLPLPRPAIFYDPTVLTLDASGTFWYSDTPGVPQTKWDCSAFPRIATWGR